MTPVTEATEGQPEAPATVSPPEATTKIATASVPAVTEATEGQPEAPAITSPPEATKIATASVPAVTEATEGQPEAPITTATTEAPATFTGGARQGKSKPALAALAGVAGLMVMI